MTSKLCCKLSISVNGGKIILSTETTFSNKLGIPDGILSSFSRCTHLEHLRNKKMDKVNWIEMTTTLTIERKS